MELNVDNNQPSGSLHTVFLRSHLAHSTITRLNLDAAAQAPGVIAVWSAADLEDLKPLEIEAPVDDTPLPERRGGARGPRRPRGGGGGGAGGRGAGPGDGCPRGGGVRRGHAARGV